MLNFYLEVLGSIEIKVRTPTKTHSKVVAKNCDLQVMYVDPVTNVNTRKFFWAKRVEYFTDPTTLNTSAEEKWTEIKDFSRLKIEQLEMYNKKANEFDITTYEATVNNSLLLIRKSDIKEVAVESKRNKKPLELYSNALVTLDCSKCTESHYKTLDKIDEFLPISVKSKNNDFENFESFLRE